MGALLVKQKPEVVLGGPNPLSLYHKAERITDPSAIAMLLSSVSAMAEENEDDLVFELMYLETLLAMQPMKVQSLLDQLGDVGEEVREEVLPPNVIDLMAIKRRSRRLRQRLGAAASRVSAAVLMLLGLPMMHQEAAKAADAQTFQIAAAPMIRVVDANNGHGVAGVQIKSMDEQLLGVTDATGQATLSEEYTETDLLSLEKDGYQMYLLDRAQLSSRNIVSMKPIDDVKTAKNGRAAIASAPKAPTAPKVAHEEGHAPKLEAPKAPTMPKSPQIRLPLKPKAAPVASPAGHLATAPKAEAPKHEAPKVAMAHAPAHTESHTAPKAEAPKHEAPKVAVAPKAHTMPVAPHQPAYKAKPMATPSEEPMTTPDMPSMNDGGSQPEAAVAVPKRVPAPRTDDGDNNGYYRVQAGDTLSSIAYRYLGNANFWPEIHAANRDAIKNPHYIRIGQRIVLPKGAPHMAKVHRATTHHYVVKPGDSLSRIAMAQLGDMTQWHKIFQANRTAIANPRYIYPGQRLIIPG